MTILHLRRITLGLLLLCLLFPPVEWVIPDVGKEELHTYRPYIKVSFVTDIFSQYFHKSYNYHGKIYILMKPKIRFDFILLELAILSVLYLFAIQFLREQYE